MKAAVCREFGQPLTIEELTLADPGPGEVKVKLAACAICHSDIHYIDGEWGGELPAVFGHEAAGVVEEIGSGVTRTIVGDHVVVTLIRSCGWCHDCIDGDPHLCGETFPLDKQGPLTDASGAPIGHGLRTAAFAEYVVVDQSQLAPIAKDVPLDSAALLGCGVITGFGAVTNTAKIPTGASVVVIGTGGVGLNSIQGAALSGAQPVIAVDLSDDKLEAARRFGATHTINPTSDNMRDAMTAILGKRRADFVIVTVGSGPAYQQGFKLMRRGGTLVMVGMPPTGVKAEIEINDFAFKGQTVLGSLMGSTKVPIDIPKLVELYKQERLKLDELISGRYKLDEINEAIDSVKRGEALRNVIVF